MGPGDLSQWGGWSQSKHPVSWRWRVSTAKLRLRKGGVTTVVPSPGISRVLLASPVRLKI